MKKLAWVAAVAVGLMALAGMAQAEDVTINAAGATFPYPIYSQWAHKYNSMTGVKLNYQSIGSGGGIAQIKAKTVDYGASDAPLKPEELKKNGLVQWPMVMGGVVMAVNIPGIGPGALKLNGPVLADMYLGKIKKWDDPAIKKPQSRAQAAFPGHHRGAPQRWFRHHLHLYELSLHDLPGMEAESRRQYLGAVAGRHRR